MKKILRWSGLAIGVALVIIQCIRPDQSAPVFDQSHEFTRLPEVDTSVASILRRSCYDCHSYETHWPWYSTIAPASWLVANDVQGGRRHLNFSIWGKYADFRRSKV